MAPFYPGGDLAQDLPRIQALFAGAQGFRERTAKEIR
jgi:hypothetical protein